MKKLIPIIILSLFLSGCARLNYALNYAAARHNQRLMRDLQAQRAYREDIHNFVQGCKQYNRGSEHKVDCSRY